MANVKNLYTAGIVINAGFFTAPIKSTGKITVITSLFCGYH